MPLRTLEFVLDADFGTIEAESIIFQAGKLSGKMKLQLKTSVGALNRWRNHGRSCVLVAVWLGSNVVYHSNNPSDLKDISVPLPIIKWS